MDCIIIQTSDDGIVFREMIISKKDHIMSLEQFKQVLKGNSKSTHLMFSIQDKPDNFFNKDNYG